MNYKNKIKEITNKFKNYDIDIDFNKFIDFIDKTDKDRFNKNKYKYKLYCDILEKCIEDSKFCNSSYNYDDTYIFKVPAIYNRTYYVCGYLSKYAISLKPNSDDIALAFYELEFKLSNIDVICLVNYSLSTFCKPYDNKFLSYLLNHDVYFRMHNFLFDFLYSESYSNHFYKYIAIQYIYMAVFKEKEKKMLKKFSI